MRKIEKRKPIEMFGNFVRRNKPDNWSQLPNEIRMRVRKHIWQEEQLQLSGYTERILDIEDESTHIDHFRKRAFFPQLIFDWDNLIVAEHSNAYGADRKDNDANFRVRSVNDYDSLIDPVHDNPHEFFSYMANGEIVPCAGLADKDRDKALYTIRCFGLNHEALVIERQTVINAIISLKRGGMEARDVKECFQNSSYPSLVEYFCSSDVFDSL